MRPRRAWRLRHEILARRAMRNAAASAALRLDAKRRAIISRAKCRHCVTATDAGCRLRAPRRRDGYHDYREAAVASRLSMHVRGRIAASLSDQRRRLPREKSARCRGGGRQSPTVSK